MTSFRYVPVLLILVLLAVGLTGCQELTKKPDQQTQEEPQQASLEELTPQEQEQALAEVPTTIEEPLDMPAPQGGGTIHVVQAGDTLYKIARQYYGQMRMWRMIWEANIDQVPDPNLITVGQRLVIP